MDHPHDTLIRNLKEHSRLRPEDVAELCNLSLVPKELSPDEDFIHQGDHPKHAVLVVSGMIARYHLLNGGRRQYLSFHMSGDLPDAQALFIERMDHALCSIGPARVAFHTAQTNVKGLRTTSAAGYRRLEGNTAGCCDLPGGNHEQQRETQADPNGALVLRTLLSGALLSAQQREQVLDPANVVPARGDARDGNRLGQPHPSPIAFVRQHGFSRRRVDRSELARAPTPR